MATKQELELLLEEAQNEIDTLKKKLEEQPKTFYGVKVSDIRQANTEHKNCVRKDKVVHKKEGFYCTLHNIYLT